MEFKLSEVDLNADFDELMTVMWDAHEQPDQPFFRLFCPINDGNYKSSLEESTMRMREWDLHDPHARWLKVQDTSTGRIAGAAWYKIYEENPFANTEDEVADWYPDDSSRDFVSQAIGQMDDPRRELAARPQVFLNILFTHPDYRRKGIGTMLVQWGIKTAKDLDVEFWLNATPVGKPLYETLGFEIMKRNPLSPRSDSPDDKWRETEKKFSEIVFWTMRLPKEEANEQSDDYQSRP